MCLPSPDAVTLTGKVLPLLLFLLRESISARVAKWFSFFAGISYKSMLGVVPVVGLACRL